MVSFITNFAETAEPSSDVLSILGIDWTLLIIQTVAFLVLLWVLSKFVYPLFMKSIDQRQKNIEDIAKAAKKSEEATAELQAETTALLTKARKEAAEILSTAKQEAVDMVTGSEKKAKKLADTIVMDAQAQIKTDIDKARRELHDETLHLVALATKKVVKDTHSQSADESLISKAIEESR